VKGDRAYLLHIRDSIDRIRGYTSGGKNDFLRDPKTQDAVIRNLEIIGEAAKRPSDTVRRQDPKVRWKQVSGMRDKLIHDYFGVNLELVWDTVERELPQLGSAVERALQSTTE
jgi:uncharacterized protein with HEPN domain